VLRPSTLDASTARRAAWLTDWLLRSLTHSLTHTLTLLSSHSRSFIAFQLFIFSPTRHGFFAVRVKSVSLPLSRALTHPALYVPRFVAVVVLLSLLAERAIVDQPRGAAEPSVDRDRGPGPCSVAAARLRKSQANGRVASGRASENKDEGQPPLVQKDL